MRAARKLMLTSLLLLGACSTAHGAKDNSRRDVDAIKARYSQWKHALDARDLNGIMSVYAPDVDAYDITPPLQFNGTDAYRKDYSDFLAELKGPIKINIPTIHIEQSGDTAYAFGLEHLRGTMMNGKPVDMWVRFTDGWKREKGGWFIEHEHVSVPVDLVTGKARLDLTP